MGLEERRVDGKVRRRSRVRLHVDSPVLRVQVEGGEGALLEEEEEEEEAEEEEEEEEAEEEEEEDGEEDGEV